MVTKSDSRFFIANLDWLPKDQVYYTFFLWVFLGWSFRFYFGNSTGWLRFLNILERVFRNGQLGRIKFWFDTCRTIHLWITLIKTLFVGAVREVVFGCCHLRIALFVETGHFWVQMIISFHFNDFLQNSLSAISIPSNLRVFTILEIPRIVIGQISCSVRSPNTPNRI